MVKIIRRLDQVLYLLLKVVVICCFIMMVLLIAAQVYTRFFTTSSLTWSEELARYLMAYMVFLSAVLVAREKGHICIDNVVNKLPPKAARLVVTVSLILQILFFSIVIVGAFRLFPTVSARLSPANQIPMNFVYLCVPFACAIMLVYCIRDIAELFIKEGAE